MVRACPHSEGNPLQIPLLLMGLEMDQEWVCVVVVTGCPTGYGGGGFLAADFKGERDAKSQSKKARPGHTRTREQESELKSYSKGAISW